MFNNFRRIYRVLIHEIKLLILRYNRINDCKYLLVIKNNS